MKFLEKDLESIIWHAQKTKDVRNKLSQRGLDITGKMFRQFNLYEYGICDLLTVTKTDKRTFNIRIYELKLGKIDINAIMQVYRYRHGVIDYLSNKNLDRFLNIELVLIGDCFDSNSNLAFLYNSLYNCQVYTYSFNIDGIKFDLETKGWRLGQTPLLDKSMLPKFSRKDLIEIIDD